MRLIPRYPLVLLLLPPLFMAVLSIIEDRFVAWMWWTDAGILLLAAVDAVLGRQLVPEVEREAPDVFSLGRKNRVRLRVSLRPRRGSLGRRKLQVQLEQVIFEHAQADGLPLSFVIRPGQTLELAYTVTPHRRGAYALGAHLLRVTSPLGLWQRQRRLDARDSVRVFPDLQSLRVFDLMARQDREHALLRAQKLKGGESEFARLRDYTRDDEYRAIDWRASARRQKLTAREYQLESNQNLFFMLDAGRGMTATSGDLTLFDHALNAALLLSRVATRNGDRVGMMGFEQAVRSFVPPSGGSVAVRRLIHAGYDLHPRLVEPDYDRAFRELSLRVHKRSLVVLFAQVLDDAVASTLLKRTRGLMPRHLPLMVLFRDDDVEELMQTPSQSETDLFIRAAAAELLRFRNGFIEKLRSHGALVIDVRPRELTPRLINHYLEIKARHLL